MWCIFNLFHQCDAMHISNQFAHQPIHMFDVTWPALGNHRCVSPNYVSVRHTVLTIPSSVISLMGRSFLTGWPCRSDYLQRQSLTACILLSDLKWNADEYNWCTFLLNIDTSAEHHLGYYTIIYSWPSWILNSSAVSDNCSRLFRVGFEPLTLLKVDRQALNRTQWPS
jgi:hypothetical protein